MDMIHIKLFEGFKKQDYYIRISEEEYRELIIDTYYKNDKFLLESPKLYKKCISDLTIRFPKLTISEHERTMAGGISGLTVNANVRFKYNYIMINNYPSDMDLNYDINITIVNDYYFVVKIGKPYLVGRHIFFNDYLFKCDDIEGLITLINDIKDLIPQL